MKLIFCLMVFMMSANDVSANGFVYDPKDVSASGVNLSLKTYPLRSSGLVCKSTFNNQFTIYDQDRKGIPDNDVATVGNKTSVLTKSVFSYQSRMLGGYIGESRESQLAKKGEQYTFASIFSKHGSWHDDSYLKNGIMQPVQVEFMIEEVEYTADVESNGYCPASVPDCYKKVKTVSEVRIFNDHRPQFIKVNYKDAEFDIACQVPTALDILNY